MMNDVPLCTRSPLATNCLQIITGPLVDSTRWHTTCRSPFPLPFTDHPRTGHHGQIGGTLTTALPISVS